MQNIVVEKKVLIDSSSSCVDADGLAPNYGKKVALSSRSSSGAVLENLVTLAVDRLNSIQVFSFLVLTIDFMPRSEFLLPKKAKVTKISAHRTSQCT